MNSNGGYQAFKVAQEVQGDKQAQRFIAESLKKVIQGLKS
jgi:hypothetical protein